MHSTSLTVLTSHCRSNACRLLTRWREARAGGFAFVLLAFLGVFSSGAAAQISLGTAADFVVLGGSTVTNTGPTVIIGNLGVSPGSAVTGFPPGIVSGSIHAGDGVAAQAHADAAVAYTQLAGEASTFNLTGLNLGGQALLPGTYKFDDSAQLVGTLTLLIGADPDATFHFQIGADFITGSGSSIILAGAPGISAQNVFWQIGTSATLGTNTSFLGTVLANTSITLNTGATVTDGRVIALNGAVTLDTNTVIAPAALPVIGTVWSGNANALWSGANWSPTLAGATSGTLAPDADVIFSVTGVAPQNQTTILDANTTISSLTVNDPADVTINGAQTLTIAGTGLNTGVTINNGAGLTTINSDLLLTGPAQAMTVNNAAGLVINGVVAGATGLTKAGVGQLTLAGANVYSGPTTLQQGTLLAGAANVIPNASAVAVNLGSVLDLNGFAQNVGSLGDGPAGGGAVNLGAAHLITGSDGSNQLFSGIISGSGSIEKVGAGTWELTGANTYLGPTTVTAGTLAINGSIAGSALVSGGTLRGLGRIGGDVVNNASVNPGIVGLPGVLTIGGNFTQSPTGALNLRLASPGAYDRLAIGGAAMLDGALNLSYLNGFRAQPGDVFQILTAAGGVTGRFANFTDANATGTVLDLQVVYRSNDVLLQIIQGSFADLAPAGAAIAANGAPAAAIPRALSPNELAAARALDQMAAGQPGNNLIASLNTLPLAQIPDALSLLSPEDFASIFSTGLAISHVQVGNIERRLNEVRQGSTGFSDSGFAVTDSRGAQNFDGKSVVDDHSKDGKDFVAPAAERDYRWGFFISGTGEWGDLESSDRARGSSFASGGVTVGADFRVNSHLVLGAALGYANTSSDLSRGGNLDIDSGKASLYATYYEGGFYLNGVVGAGYGSYDTKRQTLGGMARGDTNGADYSALLGTGYDFHLGAFTVGPIASLQYSTVGIEGFSERGALGALRISTQSQDSLRSSMGLRAAYTQKLGRVVLTPELRAQWVHEYLTDQSNIEAGFDSGHTFTTRGPVIGRDGLLLEVGAAAQLSARLAIFAYYTGELGRENYTVHSIDGGMRIAF